MKKQLTILAALGIVGLFSTSCDKDTEGVTGITYYADIELDGDIYLDWEAGTPYVDPGYTAIMDGQDITNDLTVTTDLNYSNPRPGLYSISYSYVNADGFGSAATRYVYVWDYSDPVAGYYTVDPNSYRLYNDAQVAYGSAFEIIVLGSDDGEYFVDDLLGGWYCQRAGYGTSYAMQGYITVENGVVDLIYGYVPGWGDYAEGMTDGTFDEATCTLHWDIEYTTYPMNFVVTMTKNDW